MNDDRLVTTEDEVPLNLRVRRGAFGKVKRTPSMQTLQLLGLIVSGVLLLAASRRRGRFVVPAAASLASGSLAALASVIIARRHRSRREAVIDARIEQSFPASDASSV